MRISWYTKTDEKKLQHLFREKDDYFSKVFNHLSYGFFPSGGNPLCFDKMNPVYYPAQNIFLIP